MFFNVDIGSTIISKQSKLLAIQLTIFSSSVLRCLLFLGFVVEFIRFCGLTSLNLDDITVMQDIIYHCPDDTSSNGTYTIDNVNNNSTSCDDKPDFQLNELVFRLFVGMSLFNNLVLLGSVLSDEMHSHASLTHITKIFHPFCYIFILLALLFDLRITDYYWSIEYIVVNGFWMIVHIFSICIIFKLLCYHLYTLNHEIDYAKHKNRTIKASKSLIVEGLLLAILSILSILFISFDKQIFQRFGKVKHHSNLKIWRQWIMIIYYFAQIPVLWMTNRISQFNSFVTKLGRYDEHYQNGFRECFVWIALIDLYDFIYSFIFESREYDQVMDGEEIVSGDHKYIALYKWSYSLSFAISHLILWSLCCVIEFIVKFDKQNKNVIKTKKQQRKPKAKKLDQPKSRSHSQHYKPQSRKQQKPERAYTDLVKTNHQAHDSGYGNDAGLLETFDQVQSFFSNKNDK